MVEDKNFKKSKVFKWFRKYQNIWEKVFKIKGGSVTLHFDDVGRMREVEYKYKNKIKLEKGLDKLSGCDILK